MADVLLQTSGEIVRKFVDMGGYHAEIVALSTTAVSGIISGQYKLTAAAVAISSSQALVRGVTIKAKASNAGTVWVGGATVAITDDGLGNGFALRPGDTLSIAVSNLNQIYAIGTANDVIYFAGN